MFFLQILEERSQLPVKNFKEQIMSAIHNSPVVIIRGATGCGKTTQVPQYILDEFIQGGRASECNIVVTQVSLLKCLIILCALLPRGDPFCDLVLLPFILLAETYQCCVSVRTCIF